MSAVQRADVNQDRPDVPAWALALGAVVCLVFAGLVVQTFTGRSIASLAARALPGSDSEQLSADGQSVLYVPGDTVQVGQVGVGARGQDRVFQAGDLVLLGASGRLVLLDEGNRLTDLRADDGATVTVSSLGAWDQAAGGLAGRPARYHNGAWVVDRAPLQPVGTPLHVRGAPEEELTSGFRLVPETAGRIRRRDTSSGPAVQIRASGRGQSLVLEGWEPLPSLDSAAVTVVATVRASEGAVLELALNDIVDRAGTLQKTADRRKAPNEDVWLTLQVQRRIVFASPNDRYSVGIVELRNRDWLEVRELAVYLGVLP